MFKSENVGARSCEDLEARGANDMGEVSDAVSEELDLI